MNKITAELSSLTFIKTVLMLLVILGHATSSWGGSWFVPPVYPSVINATVSGWLGGMHIYAFVLVSGYLFCYKMVGGGYKSFNKFVQNKAKRLLIPYIFVASCWVIPVSNIFFHYDWDVVFEKFVLCTSPSQLWFLWMLFWVFIIAWQLWGLLSNRGLKGLLVAGLLFCIGIVGNEMISNYFMIWTAFQYIPFFYFGIQICLRNMEGRKAYFSYFPWWVWIILYSLVFMFINRMSLPDGQIYDCLNLVLSTIFHVLGAFMAISTLGEIAMHWNWKRCTFFNSLSLCAMGMYLFHQQVVYVTMWLFNGKLPPIPHAIINLGFATVVSWGMTLILLKFRFTSLLIGVKKQVTSSKQIGIDNER